MLTSSIARSASAGTRRCSGGAAPELEERFALALGTAGGAHVRRQCPCGTPRAPPSCGRRGRRCRRGSCARPQPRAALRSSTSRRGAPPFRLLSFAHASIASSGWHSREAHPAPRAAPARAGAAAWWPAGLEALNARQDVLHDPRRGERLTGGTGASVAPRCSASAAENSLQLCERVVAAPTADPAIRRRRSAPRTDPAPCSGHRRSEPRARHLARHADGDAGRLTGWPP